MFIYGRLRDDPVTDHSTTQQIVPKSCGFLRTYMYVYICKPKLRDTHYKVEGFYPTPVRGALFEILTSPPNYKASLTFPITGYGKTFYIYFTLLYFAFSRNFCDVKAARVVKILKSAPRTERRARSAPRTEEG